MCKVHHVVKRDMKKIILYPHMDYIEIIFIN